MSATGIIIKQEKTDNLLQKIIKLEIPEQAVSINFALYTIIILMKFDFKKSIKL